MKLFVKIAYVGTAYCGYQVQPNGVTVQQKLNEAAKALFGTDCDIVGCSRTDSGVHARGFCAAISEKGTNRLFTEMEPQKIPRAMNAHLPEDISVLDAKFVRENFHPRYDVVAKEYEYLFYNSPVRNPFYLSRAWQLPVPIDGSRLSEMKEAAAFFVGERDFSALRDSGADTERGNACRKVFAASVVRTGDMISFRVRANGFLYHMVRIMAGTLAEVARGGIAPAEVPGLLASLNRRGMGVTAPACGLYLDRVFYPDIFDVE